MSDIQLIDYLLAHPHFVENVTVTEEEIIACYKYETIESALLIAVSKEVGPFILEGNTFIFPRK